MAAVVTPFPSKFHARNTRSIPLIPAGGDECYAAGKALCRRVAREHHGDWTPARNRRDPVELVTNQITTSCAVSSHETAAPRSIRQDLAST
jgi:hypothetical protein